MNELQDKAENVQCTLHILRVLRDAISDQVGWFAKQPYANDTQAAIVRDVAFDVQTMLSVFEDYLRRAKEEQDEIVDILVGTKRAVQPGGAE